MNGFRVMGLIITSLALIQLGCWLVPPKLVRYFPKRYPGPGWLFFAKRSDRRLPRTCPHCQKRDTIEYGLLVLKQWYRLATGSGWQTDSAVTYGLAGRFYRCEECLAVFKDAELRPVETGLHPLLQPTEADQDETDNAS